MLSLIKFKKILCNTQSESKSDNVDNTLKTEDDTSYKYKIMVYSKKNT